LSDRSDRPERHVSRGPEVGQSPGHNAAQRTPDATEATKPASRSRAGRLPATRRADRVAL
jgi:hypothetical protein